MHLQSPVCLPDMDQLICPASTTYSEFSPLAETKKAVRRENISSHLYMGIVLLKFAALAGGSFHSSDLSRWRR